MQQRLDKQTYRLSKLKPDENGFLRLDRIRATRAGVFIYRDKAGNETRELRPRNEVFKPESMNTLAMKPYSLEHKGGLLNSETVREYSVGSTGDSVRKDGVFVEVSAGVHKKEAVETLVQRADKGEELDVSAGYTCDIVNKSGVDPEFGPYDCIQTNIVYNHLTSTIKGRGEGCSIRLDSGAWQVDETEQSRPEGNNSPQGETAMEFITMEIPPVNFGDERHDSFQVRIPKEAEAEVLKLRGRLEDIGFAAKKLLSDRDGRFDSVNSELEKAKKELEVLNDSKLIEEKANELAETRLKVWEAAKTRMDSSAFEEYKNKPLEEIKKKVLEAKEGLSKERLDSDSAYLDAAFDQYMNEKPSKKSEKFDFVDVPEGITDKEYIETLMRRN